MERNFQYKKAISDGKIYLGIELGSTRIKSILINEHCECIATGSYTWENKLINEIWTYDINDVWTGIQESYQNLKSKIYEQYNEKIVSLKAIGISAMMHGYLVFDKNNHLLTPFRTWRNTCTQEASEILTDIFHFNIPQRWSIAHLYQSMINNEDYLPNINYMTTLAGYVHWKLTNRKILGIGDASGMFPIDIEKGKYNSEMIVKFDKLIKKSHYNFKIENILPDILYAGDNGGYLTKEGANLIDTSCELQAGCVLCPPEGDAGTGMIATNSIDECTGNISAGTSIFAMVVMKDYLEKCYKQIDMVTTPDGKPVAMVHCNNCSSEINVWGKILHEFSNFCGHTISMEEIYDLIFKKALDADEGCEGIVLYNYISSEPITNTNVGCPLLLRSSNSKFSFANIARAQLNSAVATLKIGMDILIDEKVCVKKLTAHGGFFKSAIAGAKIMSGALNTPIGVMSTAGEGGAWGIAVLAQYCIEKENYENLSSYLEKKVFSNIDISITQPEKNDVEKFKIFIEKYKKCLIVENMASNIINK